MNGPRRSLRKAALQRRVWSVPRRCHKSSSLNSKKVDSLCSQCSDSAVKCTLPTSDRITRCAIPVKSRKPKKKHVKNILLNNANFNSMEKFSSTNFKRESSTAHENDLLPSSKQDTEDNNKDSNSSACVYQLPCNEKCTNLIAGSENCCYRVSLKDKLASDSVVNNVQTNNLCCNEYGGTCFSVEDSSVPHSEADTCHYKSEDQNYPEPSYHRRKHLHMDLPSLISIRKSVPDIVLPLVCPECSMEFCAVRSLLMHFGSHVLDGKVETNSPPLLADLCTSWTNPKNGHCTSLSNCSPKDMDIPLLHVNSFSELSEKYNSPLNLLKLKEIGDKLERDMKCTNFSLEVNGEVDSTYSENGDLAFQYSNSENSVCDNGEKRKFDIKLPECLAESGSVVMINPHLALHIVSSLPSELNSNESSLMKDSLTVEARSSADCQRNRNAKPVPDILTIIPHKVLRSGGGIEIQESKCNTNGVKHLSLVVDSNKADLFQPGQQNCHNDSYSSSSSSSSKCESDTDSKCVLMDIPSEDDSLCPLRFCTVTLDEENGKGSGQCSVSNSEQGDNSEMEECHRCKHESRYQLCNGAKKYECPHCCRKFGWPTDLKRHLMMHTGEKPFECRICKSKFGRKFLLQNHLRKVHSANFKMSDIWPSK